MKCLLGVLLSFWFAGAAYAADYVWLEGENPTSKNFPCGPAGVERPQLLSGEKWLALSLDAARIEKEYPKEGILLGYNFQAPSAGNYEIWNRVGMESSRTTFDWRIDRGAWQTVGSQELSSDLTEVGFWNDVGWLEMGRDELSAGKHSLEIRLTPSFKEDGRKKVADKILYYSDAICISKGPFRPNGKFKPDDDWQTESDKEAARHVFKLASAASAAGERVDLPLDGLWQVCRFDEQQIVDRAGPTKNLPDMATARWMSILVPGNKFEVRPELRFCHRFVYRTRVDVPADLKRRSFVLRFPSQSLISSVIVNGEFCGWTKAPFATWNCDITRAVRPGQINEIAVAVKDSYYAFSEKKAGKNPRLLFNEPVAWMGAQNWVNQYFDFPIGSADYGGKSGILATPRLIVAGEVYAADVFAKPSVRKKQLGLELTLVNNSSEDRTVDIANVARLLAGEHSTKSFPIHTVTIPAGREQVVEIDEPWADPRLWWPDDPAIYALTTRIEIRGRAIDVRRTNFGFREWQWSGQQFKLNGVPWQLWADCTLSDGGKNPEGAIAVWKSHGQNTWRFWGRQFGGLDEQQALDLMDQRGIIVRRSGIFDGEGANYLHQLANGTELFDNWIDQLIDLCVGNEPSG